MTADGLLLSAQAAATLFMTGLVWFVQVVHYPLLDRVGSAGFVDYELGHTSRTSWVVAPVMTLEAALAGIILLAAPPGVPDALAWLGAALVALIWGSTFAVQVPCHRALSAGFDSGVHARLVRSNWLRTVAWTGRALVSLTMLGLLRSPA